MSAIERKLLLEGFLDGERFQLKSVVQSFGVSFSLLLLTISLFGLVTLFFALLAVIFK